MAIEVPLTIAAESWVNHALSSDLTLRAGSIALASLILIALMVRVVRRLGQKAAQTGEPNNQTNPIARTTKRSITSDTTATTTLEFTMVIPVLLFFSLLLVQSMMLMAGNMFVHHATYWATRQAIIEIPMDYESKGGYGANIVSNSKRTEKYERIHKVAAMRLIPVAGRIDESDNPSDAPSQAIVEAVRSHFEAYQKGEPKWIDSMLAPKANYAYAHTEIEVLNTRINPSDPSDVIFEELPDDPFTFGVRDPITVRVKHELNLGVPIVSRIFADGEHDGEGTGRFVEVTTQYTLTNEGVPVPLPEKPPVDRITPASSNLPDNDNDDPNNPNDPNDPN